MGAMIPGQGEPGPASGGAGDTVCAVDASAFKVNGTVDGVPISEHRQGNLNAGFFNLGEGAFDTPFVDIAPLEEGQVEVHLRWMGSLFDGAMGDATGTFIVPSPHPLAGKTFCITDGTVGFSDQPTDEGALWFRIDGANVASDGALPEDPCVGQAISAQVAGCFQNAF